MPSLQAPRFSKLMILNSSEERAMPSSKKVKRVIVLSLVGYAFMAFQSAMTTTSSIHRSLNCMTVEEKNGSKIQSIQDAKSNLSAFEQFINRLLLIDSSTDPCITDYPPNAPDVVAYDADSAVANTEPTFEVAQAEEPEPLVNDLGEYVLEPAYNEGFLEAPDPIVVTQRALLNTYDPVIYDPLDAELRVTEEDADSIAYTVALDACQSWYEDVEDTAPPDLGSDLYEAAAIIKSQVCETTELAVARHLKLREHGLVDNTRRLTGQMNYTMHALIHPMAVACPISGTAGDLYDRAKLFQSQGYNVEILGQPIIDTDLDATNPYIRINIETDVGIRDSMKLHIWTLTAHPIAVLMDFDSVLQQPLDTDIDALLGDPNMKGYYIKSPPDETTGAAGVDTGFLIVKPSKEEFTNIVNAYLSTPFDPTTGWNGEGHHNFVGGMGISGFLSYYFSKYPGYMELDRCIYASNVDDECVARVDFSEVKCAKGYEKHCGNPKNCPYDHPEWSAAKLDACHQLHRKFYEYRYQFEEQFFNKKNKQKRIGLFKTETFLGYCREPGSDGHLPMIGDIIEKPDWQTICPPDQCAEGTMMKPDCTCTVPGNPCDACPDSTYCQTSPTLMCIDCNCGFCDSGGSECCDFNGVNNCKTGPGNNKDCGMNNDFFPAFMGSGNVCGGVEISRTAVPNGCGCKPKSASPCTYSPKWGETVEKCFICTALDLSLGACESCKDCVAGCSNGDCMASAKTSEDFVACLDGINDAECRASCHHSCMKN